MFGIVLIKSLVRIEQNIFKEFSYELFSFFCSSRTCNELSTYAFQCTTHFNRNLLEIIYLFSDR